MLSIILKIFVLFLAVSQLKACLHLNVSNFYSGWEHYDGIYTKISLCSNRPVYMFQSYYLYYFNDANKWRINDNSNCSATAGITSYAGDSMEAPLGTWLHGIQVTCKVTDINCTVIPILRNGGRTSGSCAPGSQECAVGETVAYTCNQGYTFDGLITSLTCGENGSFSPANPSSCIGTNCTHIPTLVNGRRTSGSCAIGSAMCNAGETVMYTCNEGYTYDGQIRSLTCEGNGFFSPANPSSCIGTNCTHIPTLVNGRRTSGSCAIGSAMCNAGETVMYTCNRGYTFDGQIRSLTCEGNGSFSPASPSSCIGLSTTELPPATTSLAVLIKCQIHIMLLLIILLELV